MALRRLAEDGFMLLIVRFEVWPMLHKLHMVTCISM